MPEFLRKMLIRILVHLTQSAAGQKAGSLRGLSARQSLKLYREYTAHFTDGLSCREAHLIRKKMYRNAWRAGRLLAILCLPGGEKSKEKMIRSLYRGIGISLQFEEDREDGRRIITVGRCSFSCAYTPYTCYIMSGFDAGIICGIFGGGSLVFHSRITEGLSACRAVYRPGGEMPQRADKRLRSDC